MHETPTRHELQPLSEELVRVSQSVQQRPLSLPPFGPSRRRSTSPHSSSECFPRPTPRPGSPPNAQPPPWFLILGEHQGRVRAGRFGWPGRPDDALPRERITCCPFRFPYSSIIYYRDGGLYISFRARHRKFSPLGLRWSVLTFYSSFSAP